MNGVEALDLLPEAVVVLAPDRTVELVNDRARDLLGLGGDAVGRLIGDVLALRTEAGTPCPDPVPDRGTSHRIAESTWWLRLADGRDRVVAMAGRWRDDDGIVLTFRSATRRVASETARSDVVATVSHELRTPLATVRGFTKAMLGNWERFSDEQRRTFLAAIEEDVDRVSRLLGDLVAVSRIDARRPSLQLEPVDLAAVAAAVVDKAGVRPSGRGRDVRVAEGSPASMVVRGDPQRLEQVLTNLVENALVHAPGAGVRVHLREQAGDEVEVDVVDDGPGIPVDQRERVFDKFGRGHQSRRSGTGLGLFIARGFARAHGGDVVLLDGPAGGTTFRVRLPVSGPATG